MAKQKPSGQEPEAAPSSEAGKEPVNARIDPALLERCRNAVWHIGRGKTLAWIVSEGMERVVSELEEEHNGGKPFPPRDGELPKSSRKRPKPGKA